MKLIDQSHEIIFCPDTLGMIERAGRTCYKSEDKITEDSSEKFVKMLVDRGHHAMIEFGDIIVRFITNRGVTHELVRHRLCSFAQESTRYVKYDGEMEFIRPVWMRSALNGHIKDYHLQCLESFDERVFISAMMDAEARYKSLLDAGWRPEQAREVLPNALKTEIVVKANVREWRHIFLLRTSLKAHPQMRGLMAPLQKELREKLPVLF